MKKMWIKRFTKLLLCSIALAALHLGWLSANLTLAAGTDGGSRAPSLRPDRPSGLRDLPPGLDEAEWRTIQGHIIAQRYGIQTGPESTLQASNPAQGWQTTFAGGLTSVAPINGSWNLGLRLTGVGNTPVSDRPREIWTERNRVYSRWNSSLVEWVHNDERGLKQTFELSQRPEFEPGRLLTLTLAVEGGLQARLQNGLQQVTFHDRENRARLTYGELLVYDARGAEVPAWFDAQGDRIRIIVDDRQAVYPLTIDPLLQEAYLKASNTSAGDWFGWSVAISGETLVVGAPYERSNAIGVNGDQKNIAALNAGAAYVFVRNGATWNQQAYLKASNTESNDNFGYAVAVSGDTIVVGAPFEDSSAVGVNGIQTDNASPGSGAAYVFVRNGAVWSQQAYLKASNTGPGDHFGNSVAVFGDSIVVGAPYEASSAVGVNGDQNDDSAPGAGAAYLFVRNGTNWTQQAYLKASNTESLDYFGLAVAVDGDTVFVGAPFEGSSATGINGDQTDNSAINAGAVYVFLRNGTNWSQQAYLKASDTTTNSFLGQALSISGESVLCGAPGVANETGAAYVFIRTGAAWNQQGLLTASNGGAGDWFGQSVALSGDKAVIGAPREASAATGNNGDPDNNTAIDAGAAYVFQRSGGTWSQIRYLKASNTDAGDFFGWSAALFGDRAVFGSPWESSKSTGVNGDQSDNSALRAGAAYLFYTPTQYLPIIFR